MSNEQRKERLREDDSHDDNSNVSFSAPFVAKLFISDESTCVQQPSVS
jgi:hypothetical protein